GLNSCAAAGIGTGNGECSLNGGHETSPCERIFDGRFLAHRVSHASDSGFQNCDEHSAAILQCLLQAGTQPLYLYTGFARYRDRNQRTAEAELLPFVKRHDIETIDDDIFIYIAGLDMKLVEDAAGDQKDLATPRMAAVMIT